MWSIISGTRTCTRYVYTLYTQPHVCVCMCILDLLACGNNLYRQSACLSREEVEGGGGGGIQGGILPKNYLVLVKTQEMSSVF